MCISLENQCIEGYYDTYPPRHLPPRQLPPILPTRQLPPRQIPPRQLPPFYQRRMVREKICYFRVSNIFKIISRHLLGF